jgi:hypothetical protein
MVAVVSSSGTSGSSGAPVPVPSVAAAALRKTLTVVTSTYLGESTVRKSVGRVNTDYVGSEIVDRFITLDVAASLTISEPLGISVFVIQTSVDLTISVNGGPQLPVSQFLLLDSVPGDVVVNNPSNGLASIHITYLVN